MIRRADDTGSLAFAMLLTMVGISLTALLVPTVIGQVQSTRDDARRVVAINAAQAGLDVAVNHIQAAVDGTGAGVLAKLPCGSFTGSVTSGGARYQVSVWYYKNDPEHHETDSTWLSAVANTPILCISGGGAFSTPAYALLCAQGTDQATGAFPAPPSSPQPCTSVTGSGQLPVRTLFATYAFTTNNQNIAGGAIRTYQSSTQLCLDAGSASPGPGTVVKVQPCVANSKQQAWAYTTDLNLLLTSTQTAGNPMCVDGGSSPESSGTLAILKSCVSPKIPKQMWSLDDNSYFKGTDDANALNGLCLNEQTADFAGSKVVLTNSCSTRWAPDAAVGAGAAGPGTGQLVNFLEFGRCLDVTNQDVTYAYEIAWPCKQAPNPATLTWNQVYTYPVAPPGPTPASGTIKTTYNSTPYCLKSPNSTAKYANYPVIKACGGGPTADEIWKFYGNTGDYKTSYIIQDRNGYCLAPTDQYATSPDLFSGGVLTSKITVAVCDGSNLQKWNADPNILQSTPLNNMGEN